jgi:hypothetical protein
MTPDEILDALQTSDWERVRAGATEGFRLHIPADEIAKVWTELEADVGAVVSVGPNRVLHDLWLHCERGDAHLQAAYEGDILTGLMLLGGPPTGSFGQ